MSMVTENSEKRALLDTRHNAWNVIASIPVAAGKTVEVYAEISALTDDLSARATFDAAGLFYRNVGDDVEIDGSIVKPKIGSLLVDVDIAPNIADETIEIKVQGIASTLIHWDCKAQIRTRTDVREYGAVATDYPRMQVSIVGMKAKKKFGWMGLSDGINYVLYPTRYEHSKQLTGATRFQTENWDRAFSKRMRGATHTDRLRLHASLRGNSTAWTIHLSQHTFRWYTYMGDWGTGGIGTYVAQVTEPTAGVNGYLRNPCLLNWAIGSGSVTFLWSRHDVRGWRNYLGGYTM